MLKTKYTKNKKLGNLDSGRMTRDMKCCIDKNFRLLKDLRPRIISQQAFVHYHRILNYGMASNGLKNSGDIKIWRKVNSFVNGIKQDKLFH